MKAVFVGSKNDINQILVHWLSQRIEMAGVIWTQSTDWQRSWKGRLTFARRRMRRYGVFKVIDETLFHLYYHARLNGPSEAALKEQLVEPYWREHGDCEWRGDAIATKNINSPEVLEFVEQRQPDIAFAMCTNDYFGKRLRSLPRHGVFLWHEGFTPEYKGLYSPFWATSKLDFDRIGYTLLKMSDDLDAGEVYLQGQVKDVDPMRQTHDFMGHKAILDSLSDVEPFLRELEQGTAKPLDRSDAPSASYTYPGMSDFIRQRIRLRRHARMTPKQQQNGNSRQAAPAQAK